MGFFGASVHIDTTARSPNAARSASTYPEPALAAARAGDGPGAPGVSLGPRSSRVATADLRTCRGLRSSWHTYPMIHRWARVLSGAGSKGGHGAITQVHVSYVGSTFKSTSVPRGRPKPPLPLQTGRPQHAHSKDCMVWKSAPSPTNSQDRRAPCQCRLCAAYSVEPHRAYLHEWRGRP